MFILDSKQLTEDAEWTRPLGYIGHPKTASQATRAALRKTGARNPGGHHGFDEKEVESILRAGGIVVSTVRNPWDLMASWYGYNSMKPYNPTYPGMDPFDEWLPRVLEAGNGWIEKGLFYGAHLCNRIIRFEYNIEKQLNQCLSDCGLPPVILERVGESPRLPYQEYYTPALAIMVERRFRDEIEEWGYDYEDVVK